MPEDTDKEEKSPDAFPEALSPQPSGNGPQPASGLASISTGSIQAKKERNISRGFEIDSDKHPVVVGLKEALERDPYLVEPIAVRLLHQPVKRPCGSAICCPTQNEIGEHTYDLVFGFRRFIACRLVKKETLYLGDNAEVKLLGVVSDHEADRLNIQENTLRGEPSEYEVGKALYDTMERRQISVAETAYIVSCRTDLAERYVRIFKNCPKELLEAWKRQSTPDIRRRMVFISTIEGKDEADKHRKMRDEWARLAAEAALTPAGSEPTGGRGRQRGPRCLSYLEIQALREQVDQAFEIYDTSDWRPLSDSEKRAIQAVLRHVAAPKSNQLLLR